MMTKESDKRIRKRVNSMVYNLYHGSNRQRGERMLFDGEKLISRGEKHWLGDGLYLFFDFLYAYKWIIDMYKKRIESCTHEYEQLIKDYIILEFKVTLDDEKIFDLTNPNHKILYDRTLKAMKAKGELPNRKYPEGVVLNYMFEEIFNKGQFEAVQAVFQMYKNQYDTRWRLGYMPQKQICIRNWDIVQTLNEYDFEHRVEESNELIKSLYYKNITL